CPHPESTSKPSAPHGQGAPPCRRIPAIHHPGAPPPLRRSLRNLLLVHHQDLATPRTSVEKQVQRRHVRFKSRIDLSVGRMMVVIIADRQAVLREQLLAQVIPS